MTLRSHIQTITRRFTRRERPTALDLMDMGLTRSEFSILQNARRETRAQMEAMASQFGLSTGDLGADRWQELDVSLVCAQCRDAGRCEKFLAGHGGFAAEDCPNAVTYRQMAKTD